MPFSFTIPFVSSRKSTTHSYHPVPAPDEETLLSSSESKETRISPFWHDFFLDPSFWLTVLTILSIAITVRNLLAIQLYSQGPGAGYLETIIRSPYNGLEKLVRNESSPSWPLSSTHYPDFVGATVDQYIDRALTNGSVVRLDSRRTVIIQHRVRDYGLEYCAIRLELSRPTKNGHGQSARGYGHIGESPYLTLWRVGDMENNAVLTPSTLPTSLPSKREFLGNINLDGMRSVQSPTFRCDMGSIQTLEIAVVCASDPCIMESIIRTFPQQGFYVVQSEQPSTPK